MPANTRSLVAYSFALLAGLAVLASFWFWLGRPVPLADAVAAGKRMQCASYTPFTRDQSPLVPGFYISREQIDRDFSLLKRYFGCVRTYSVLGLERVPEVARAHGLKVMLGAWVSSDPVQTRQELDTLVRLAAEHADVVTSVIVGNEVLLRREQTGDQMVQLIREVKARVAQPVTYADVWVFWLQHPQVAPEVDFVTIHLLPYWEDVPMGIDQALAHVAEVHQQMAARYPGKPIFVGETGWPSEGRQRETAIPSRENEARFIRGFVHMAEERGWGYNLIEAFDQPWKRLHEGVVGGYWGLFDTDRHDKGVLAGPVSNVPDWQAWLAVAAAIALALAWLAGLPARGAGALAPLLAGAGAALAAFHLRAGTISARGAVEWLWNWGEVALGLAVLLAAALALVQPQAGWRAALAERARGAAPLAAIGLGFFAAVAMVGLAFEPRYLNFPWAAFAAPALALFALRRAGWLPPRPELKLLGALLVLGAPVVCYRELVALRPEGALLVMNEQAVAWLAVSLLLAAALLRAPRRAPA